MMVPARPVGDLGEGVRGSLFKPRTPAFHAGGGGVGAVHFPRFRGTFIVAIWSGVE